MGKLNCWEAKRCGKQATCPAAQEQRLNGVNGGVNGGRACWVVTATKCRGEVQGNFAAKLANCMKCEVYARVREEEGANLAPARDVLSRLA